MELLNNPILIVRFFSLLVMVLSFVSALVVSLIFVVMQKTIPNEISNILLISLGIAINQLGIHMGASLPGIATVKSNNQ